jgi:hypothetical protein
MPNIAGDPGRYTPGVPRRMPFSRLGFAVVGMLLLAILGGGVYMCASSTEDPRQRPSAAGTSLDAELPFVHRQAAGVELRGR